MKNHPCVYILLLENNQYYIGSTSNIKERIRQHNRGKTRGIKFSKPQKLVLVQEYDSVSESRKVEFRLKKLKNRKIIEKIVEDGFIKLRV
jgi:putative endonuclease